LSIRSQQLLWFCLNGWDVGRSILKGILKNMHIGTEFTQVTFIVPIKDIASFRPRGKAEQQLDLLVTHLAHGMQEDNKDSIEKHLIFHTFSNTIP
jgi:hypothetical protein